MNNKNNDSDPFTAEKLQSTHPQITVSINDTSSKSVDNSNNECVPKTPSSAPTKVSITSSPTTVTKPAATIIKKASSPAIDRKIHPYTATLPNDCVRVPPKPSAQTTFVKAAPKVIPEKVSGNKNSAVLSIPASVSKLSTSSDVKKSINMQLVRTAAQTITKPAEKGVVSSTTSSVEESRPSSSEIEHKNTEKVTPTLSTRPSQKPYGTTNIFEKNIETNVLTFTRNIVPKTPIIPRANPSKDSRTTEINTVNISKSSTSTTITTTTSSVSTTTTFSPSTPKSTQPKPVMLVTDNLPKNITQTVKSVPKIDSTSDPKPSAMDKIVKNAKVVIVTSADSSVKNRSPSPSVSSSPKLQTESFAVPPSPTVKNLKPNQSPGNLQLSSLSEVEKNKDIINAINSGSTASIGENVTISSAPVDYVYLYDTNARSMSDTKIRNVSNKTTIEAITKQVINPGSPIQKNKNGNSAESAGQLKQEITPTSSAASSPGESRTPKRSEIPGLLGDGEKLIDNLNALKKKLEEPVECLTISSDEEEAESEQFVTSDNNEVSVSILNKEPQMERDEDASKSSDGNAEKEADLMLETTTGAGFTNLICRTVRIGSYKIRPRNGVTISQYGLKIVVPPLNNPNDSVTVKIPIHDIAKVLVHYNRSLPVIFYYINPKAGAKIRQTLKMYDSSYLYFDPNSPDESHRRITLLPEKFTDQDKEDISAYYLHRDVLDELTHGEANQLLVKSAPKDIQKTVRLPPNPVQTIMVYPPPPARGGISINTEDYSCLAEDTYLNDVIIDFYLKYLYHEKLTEEDRQKTHIFSSFFYKRLTDKATPVPRALQNSKPNDATITPAEIRHDRVKKWTKNIDIFSKDYIVIPLNENQHWFLAIICFPGLSGPLRFSDNTPIDIDSPKKPEAPTKEAEVSISKEKELDAVQTTIGSTTITPISGNLYALNDEDGDMEDRDEADGADEDVDEIFSSDEESNDYSDMEHGEICEEEVPPKKKAEKEPIKQPCILIFDSLKSTSRARIIATLREYLHVEYKMKHNGEERDFSKNVVKGACPRVPQQNNYTDCGLFVLHYVEMFFEKKIEDFNIPMRQLHHWFDSREVGHKRYIIQKLLLRLMEEQKINVDALQLPELNLSPRPYSDDYEDSEDLNEYMYYEDDDEEGDGRMEHFVYDDDDDIEEHDARMRRLMTEEDEDVDVDDYMAGGEDEEEEEEEEGETGHRFDMYDEPPEDSSSNFSDDDDDAYRDLDDLDLGHIANRHQARHTLIEVTGDGSEGEEIMHEEEEEEAADEIDEDEHELRLNSLNKENVTISRMPAGSGGVAVGKSSHNESRSTSLDELKFARSLSECRNSKLEEFKAARGLNESRNTTLEELKAARPLKKLNEVSIERATEDDCPGKKFKSNSN